MLDNYSLFDSNIQSFHRRINPSYHSFHCPLMIPDNDNGGISTGDIGGYLALPIAFVRSSQNSQFIRAIRSINFVILSTLLISA